MHAGFCLRFLFFHGNWPKRAWCFLVWWSACMTVNAGCIYTFYVHSLLISFAFKSIFVMNVCQNWCFNVVTKCDFDQSLFISQTWCLYCHLRIQYSCSKLCSFGKSNVCNCSSRTIYWFSPWWNYAGSATIHKVFVYQNLPEWPQVVRLRLPLGL